MLQNILVPLDGSPVGESALPYAVALAGRSGARLTLVRAAHIPPLTIDKGTAQARALSEAEAYLRLHADELRARDYVVDTSAPYGASAADWIVEEAGLRHADLIVMGTHDRVGPDRWLHGSVAEAVVSRSPVPVLLIHAADGMRPFEHFDWRQPALVVPLDGSELAEAALPVAIDLARSVNGRVILVSVLPEPGKLEPHPGGYLEAYVERLTRAAVPVESFIRTGEPAAQIGLVAHEQNAAAVVMATHGRTGLVRTVLGSIAGQVVHCSPSPVLLVRPSEPRRAGQPIPVQS
jgi:nucleotide-binding universal stress UspA family protein